MKRTNGRKVRRAGRGVTALILWASLGTAVLVAGSCAPSRGGSDRAGGLRAVDYGSEGAVLGEATVPPMPADEFVAAVADRLRADRLWSATEIVRVHPESARAALVARLEPIGPITGADEGGAGGATAAGRPVDETERVIAASLDALLGGSCGVAGGGWREVVAARVSRPGVWAGFGERHRRARSLIAAGRFDEAATIDLLAGLEPAEAEGEGATGGVAGPVPGVLRVEAARLRGLALMLGGSPDRAAAVLARPTGARIGSEEDPAVDAPDAAGSAVDRAGLLLLAAEALDRAGRAEQATRMWELGVELAAGCAIRQARQDRPATPGLWDRASRFMPDGASATPGLARLAGQTLGAGVGAADRDRAGTARAMLAALEGAALLERGSAERALVALKRAEAGLPVASARDRARLLQAEGLVALRQREAATAVLADVSSSRAREVRRRARARLGVLQIERGAVESGAAILRSVLENWPEPARAEERAARARVRADLGLALLALGDEDAGRAELDAARVVFDAAGHAGEWLRATRNLARYLEFEGDGAGAAALRGATSDRERSAGARRLR